MKEKVLRDALLVERLDKEVTHRVDAVAHLADFSFPLRAQFRVVEHRGDDGRTVRRRVGVVGADHALDVAERSVGSVRLGNDERQRADALVVEAEILGVGAGDQHVWTVIRQFNQPGGVRVQPLAKPW
jgi:hypothetical protein